MLVVCLGAYKLIAIKFTIAFNVSKWIVHAGYWF